MRLAARLLDGLPRRPAVSVEGARHDVARRGGRCASVSGLQGLPRGAAAAADVGGAAVVLERSADSTSLTGRDEAAVDSQLPWRRGASGAPAGPAGRGTDGPGARRVPADTTDQRPGE